MGRMDGKVALITGAARGMGRSHAATLAREGADIIALDIAADIDAVKYGLGTESDLEQTVKEVHAANRDILALKGDVRNQADIDEAVRQGIGKFGKIDVVVANAGVWTVGDLWKLSEQEWAEVLDVNASGVWRTIKAVAPHMIERQEGSIVLIASAGVRGNKRIAHYVASKCAVVGLMKCAAQELGDYGVRCNVILPGVIDTPINKWQGAYDLMAGGDGLGTPELLDTAGAAVTVLPGRTLLSPQAVSNAVLFLASDESSEVTGIELSVDAGTSVLPGLNGAVAVQQALAAAAAQNSP
jgi:SDR family mycofactocin-dependent oxidoreductase